LPFFLNLGNSFFFENKENLNKIFDPFFTTKEGDKGTALGLSLVYDAINKHNGDISVESKVAREQLYHKDSCCSIK
jgi:nitrogen fixation/metabolism regulation signal transduction histidine kinase